MTTPKENSVNSGSKIAMSLDQNTYFLTCNDIIELSRATLSTKAALFYIKAMAKIRNDNYDNFNTNVDGYAEIVSSADLELYMRHKYNDKYNPCNDITNSYKGIRLVLCPAFWEGVLLFAKLSEKEITVYDVIERTDNSKIIALTSAFRKALATWFCNKESHKQVRLSCWTVKEIKEYGYDEINYIDRIKNYSLCQYTGRLLGLYHEVTTNSLSFEIEVKNYNMWILEKISSVAEIHDSNFFGKVEEIMKQITEKEEGSVINIHDINPKEDGLLMPTFNDAARESYFIQWYPYINREVLSDENTSLSRKFIREHIKKHELKLKQLCKGEIASIYQNVNAKWERMVWPIEQFDMVDEIFHFLMGLEMETKKEKEIAIMSLVVRNFLWPEVLTLLTMAKANLTYCIKDRYKQTPYYRQDNMVILVMV
ncbi:PREDICTED: uncharacterized protein LOC109585532 [Amphimedon queenslandica]|uniref:Uncharacterized protein n=1 Tax=Amphimedon queenslandica TaxID=400682 RepID=A0AAN0JJS0_AMPQE|nr:PREDICTED: uncharacterized protein LOC109585532 [Amphimedon queenslandica]|eukprot:XP_019857219.1 PREDICTED: uncharacterized protein LOC109585532 [Amphimedon queenslandica]